MLPRKVFMETTTLSPWEEDAAGAKDAAKAAVLAMCAAAIAAEAAELWEYTFPESPKLRSSTYMWVAARAVASTYAAVGDEWLAEGGAPR